MNKDRVDRVRFEDMTPSARIREAALRLFAADGIQETSLRAVARAAGVSLGALVHHFPTREALERAVADEVHGRIAAAVHGIGSREPTVTALAARRRTFAALLDQQPYLAGYVRQTLSGSSADSIEFFRQSLVSERSEMQTMVDAGLARPMSDPEVGIALYWILVNARFLMRPHMEAALGLDLSDPADAARLERAEIELLTVPLFPLREE